MAYKDPMRQYRHWYEKLVCLYPNAFRERYGEGLVQTFYDLCQEREKAGKSVFGFALWASFETVEEIIRERMAIMAVQNKRIIVMLLAVLSLLMIPLVAMQFTDEVSWDLADFIIMGGALLGVGLAYELIARNVAKKLKLENSVYRFAFGIGLLGAFLLFWVNGAVGIIGNEGQTANLLYGAVFIVGLVGSLVSRFKPRGMSRTLFTAALIQLLIPVIALIAWPRVSWGGAGMGGVFVFNAVFAVMFAGSALLFLKAARREPERGTV